ncbi:hypothetical protein GIB67_006308 [Kingdonia uniflora]|uniref:RNase H type-1 domain-containing protein n=1 Tax=Kingdonia uniflora TaxID=39325 RepID=A0A7J7P5D4_9MAGN|nr:hypothetical protein GIB67_006308 [Kingdonia uniflora]
MFKRNGRSCSISLMFHTILVTLPRTDNCGRSIIVDMLVLELVKNGNIGVALETFERVGDYRFRLSIFSCNPLLNGLVKKGTIQALEIVYKEIIKRRIIPNLIKQRYALQTSLSIQIRYKRMGKIPQNQIQQQEWRSNSIINPLLYGQAFKRGLPYRSLILGGSLEMDNKLTSGEILGLQTSLSWNISNYPGICGSNDEMVWKLDLHGEFTTKNAFDTLRRREDTIWWWRYVWSNAIHPRLGGFAWCLLNHLLPLDDTIMKKGLQTAYLMLLLYLRIHGEPFWNEGQSRTGGYRSNIQKQHGEVLGTYNKSFGQATNYIAEITAIIEGVRRSVTQGWRRVWVVSDSAAVIKVFLKAKLPWSLKSVWNLLTPLLQNIWFSHVWRILPTVVTYNTLIDGYCKSSIPGKMYKADALLKEMVSKDVRPSLITFNILIDGYCKNENVSAAMKLFVKLKNPEDLKPSVETYNCLINGLCNNGKLDEALCLRDEMLDTSSKVIFSNVVTYNSLINGFCKKGLLEEARKLFDFIQECGLVPSVNTYSTLMDGYCKDKKMEEAIQLRNLMSLEKDNICIYNCLIGGFCRNGNMEEANKLLDEMGSKIVRADSVTYNILIGSLCKVGKLKKAVELLKVMFEMGLNLSHLAYNTLMNGYCMKGNLEAALYTRKRMEKLGRRANVATYNVLIRGLCQKGKLEEANGLLNEMLEKGLIPNRVTYEIIKDEMLERDFVPDIDGHLYRGAGGS